MRHLFFPVPSILAVMLALGEIPVLADESTRYDTANIDSFLWTSQSVDLGPDQVPTANALVAIVTNYSEVPLQLKRKSLAIALRLEPLNPNAFKTDFLLKRGQRPTPTDGYESVDLVQKQLHAVAQKLAAQEAGQTSFAAYVNDVALEFEASQKFADHGRPLQFIAKPDWSQILGEVSPPSTSKALPKPAHLQQTRQNQHISFSKFQGKATHTHCLIVAPFGETELRGDAIRIDIVPTSSSNVRGTHLDIDFDPNAVTETAMRTSMHEAIKYLRFRLGVIPDGLEANVVFAGVYDKRNGPSATLACALGLYSIITGTPIDPSVASISDMNADGSLQPVGSIHSELGALATPNERHSSISAVIIPQEHVADARDTLILHGVKPFIEKPIFAASDFTAALQLAAPAADRDAPTQKALNDFAEISAILKTDVRSVKNPHILERLRQLAKSRPDFISPRMIYLAATNQGPKSLSLEYSILLVDEALSPFFERNNDRVYRDDFDSEAFKILRKHDHLIDRRFRSIINAVSNASSRSRLSATSNAELKDARDRILLEYKKVVADVEIRELLMR